MGRQGGGDNLAGKGSGVDGGEGGDDLHQGLTRNHRNRLTRLPPPCALTTGKYFYKKIGSNPSLSNGEAVGRAVTPQDASLKVTGTAVYTYDCSIPGTLHAKLVTSTMPHARITRIDTTASKAGPGVVPWLAGQDMPIRGWTYAGGRELLPVENVRWSGRP